VGVGRGGHDDHPVEQVQRDAVWALVGGAADARDAAVGRHHHHGRRLRLQRAVQEREALDVQHVSLETALCSPPRNIFFPFAPFAFAT
jgi:hypothetical protein